MKAALIAAALSAAASLSIAAQQTVFRGAVDSVQMSVAVHAGNRPVTNLTAKDFSVTDNGVAQRILDVTRESQPMDVTLIVDVSSSTRRLIPAIASGVNRVRERLRDRDRLAVVAFNERVREFVEMTEADALRPITIRASDGATSLYDAIAVALATPPEIGRRQMAIVFTDGLDSISFLDERAVLDVARRSRTAVFGVAATTQGLVPRIFFDELASLTGGLSQILPPYVVSRDGTSIRFGPPDNLLDAAFIKAFDDFRTSYVLRYVLEGVPSPGWHDVVVRVPGKSYQIRASRGYFGR
jgi:Mg-chelatase subunit ChlD